MKSLKSIYNSLLNENDHYGDKPGISDYDNLMKGNLNSVPNEWRDYSSEVVNISPDDYLKLVADLQNTSYEQQLSYIDNNKVKRYMNDMSNGDRFPMPYINYATKDQEGRHRALASKRLGDDTIPVLIVKGGDSVDNSDYSHFPYFVEYDKNGYSGEYSHNLRYLAEHLSNELRNQLMSDLKSIDDLNDIMYNLDIDTLDNISDDDLLSIFGESRFSQGLKELEEKMILKNLSMYNKKQIELNDGKIDDDDLLHYNDFVNKY